LSSSHESVLNFNLSHSAEFILCGVFKEHLIGVDIEHYQHKLSFEQIAERFFAKEEADRVKGANVEQQPLVFYSIWTKKEALLKALGVGLHEALDQFAVTDSLGCLEGVRAFNLDTEFRGPWWIFSLDFHPNF
jgi:4'-phosphopantetheinyl transferase